ncbi:hypothetical protein NVP1121O_215 [Vibrio phage 1.121.O._10N.286.46.C4]|nr:hypothetical protein NVP1121O_215 [Vibrio phage 1.121.O._10N.286.46.C4]
MIGRLKLEDFVNMLITVEQWNAVAGNLEGDRTLTEAYRGFTYDEMFGKEEFLEGYRTGDLVMQADGIADMVYTSFFWSLSFRSFDRVRAALCRGVRQGYQLPVESSTDLDDTVFELVEILQERFVDISFVREMVVLMIQMQDKLDIRKAFDKVTTSNFSKYPLVSEIECPEKEIEFITGQGRYTDVTYKTVGEGEEQRYVFLAGQDVRDGTVFTKAKIVKPSTFQDVVGMEECIL